MFSKALFYLILIKKMIIRDQTFCCNSYHDVLMIENITKCLI